MSRRCKKRQIQIHIQRHTQIHIQIQGQSVRGCGKEREEGRKDVQGVQVSTNTNNNTFTGGS